MPKPVHKVAIVIDRNFGARLADLARDRHVWVVGSQSNAAAVQRYLTSAQMSAATDRLGAGITSFVAEDGETPEDTCARVASDVDEHHGEFAHDPPWSEIEVFGAELTSALRQTFAELGAEVWEATRDGFLCRRVLAR
jgi:hypothetical protein